MNRKLLLAAIVLLSPFNLSCLPLHCHFNSKDMKLNPKSDTHPFFSQCVHSNKQINKQTGFFFLAIYAPSFCQKEHCEFVRSFSQLYFSLHLPSFLSFLYHPAKNVTLNHISFSEIVHSNKQANKLGSSLSQFMQQIVI